MGPPPLTYGRLIQWVLPQRLLFSGFGTKPKNLARVICFQVVLMLLVLGPHFETLCDTKFEILFVIWWFGIKAGFRKPGCSSIPEWHCLCCTSMPLSPLLFRAPLCAGRLVAARFLFFVFFFLNSGCNLSSFACGLSLALESRGYSSLQGAVASLVAEPGL